MNAQKDVELYLFSFFNLGTREGRVVDATPAAIPPPPRERDPVAMVQEAGWSPGPISKGAEDLALLGFNPRTVQPLA